MKPGIMTIRAKYENGVFRPLADVTIQGGTVVEVNVPEAAVPSLKSIREFGLAGMWADRDDIPDGVTYVNRLRDNPRGD